MSLLNAISDINEISSRANYVKARYSMNDDDRETANIRDYCNNKFSFFRLKKIFISVTLPVLLIVLFAF